MKNYLTKFNTTSDYNSFIEGNTKEYVNVSYIVDDDEVKYYNEKDYYIKQYLTFKVVEAGTITIIKNDSSDPTVTIQYSTDNGQNWTSLTTSTTEQSLGTFTVGDKVMIKGINNQTTFNHFSGTAKVNVYGNIMSLLYGDNFIGQTTLTNNDTFISLFQNYTNLLSAENLILPATTLANHCYRLMFDGCISLTAAPQLPATIVLEQSYSNMFRNCTSLTTAPELPATTIADSCYFNMFANCTSLTTAPELPATTMYRQCYMYMFNGCTSLTTAPELPATTLAVGCYNYMFQNCTLLNYIKCLATKLHDWGSTTNWLNNVSSSGTFVKNSSMTKWPSGASGIPSGWTVQDA